MITKLKSLFDKTMLRFIMVGIINTLVGTAIMFGLYNLAGFSYWASSATNYCLTSILSFLLNKHVTFKSKGYSVEEVLRFAINIAVCYLLAYGLAKPFTLWALSSQSETFKTNVAMVVGMVFFTGFNYLGQRFFTFKKGL